MHGFHGTSLLRPTGPRSPARAPRRTPARDARQLWLPILGPPGLLTDGVFLGVVPNRDLARLLHRIAAEARNAGLFFGDLVRPDLIHLTLLWFMFNGVPLGVVEKLGRAARSLCLHPFTLELDELVITKDGLLLGASDTSSVASLLRCELQAALRRDGWEWGMGIGHAPHLTLGHGTGHGVRVRIEPVIFPVSVITVIRSLHGQGRHEYLDHIVLTDPAPHLAASLPTADHSMHTAGAYRVTA